MTQFDVQYNKKIQINIKANGSTNQRLGTMEYMTLTDIPTAIAHKTIIKIQEM